MLAARPGSQRLKPHRSFVRSSNSKRIGSGLNSCSRSGSERTPRSPRSFASALRRVARAIARAPHQHDDDDLDTHSDADHPTPRRRDGAGQRDENSYNVHARKPAARAVQQPKWQMRNNAILNSACIELQFALSLATPCCEQIRRVSDRLVRVEGRCRGDGTK